MKILRLGGLGVSPYRILDLIENKDISKVTIVYKEDEQNRINQIVNCANFFGINNILKQKVDFIKIKRRNKITKLGKFYNKVKSTFCINLDTEYAEIIDLIDKDHIIWVGENDFDGSNAIIPFLRKIGKKNLIIRTYKESRFCKNELEMLSLKYADILVLPHTGYLEFFSELYPDLDINDKVIFADQDWRYYRLITYLNDKKFKKLSEDDGKIHFCILTGVAYWTKNINKRSGSRYNFLSIIKEITNIDNFVVHLHSKKFMSSEFKLLNLFPQKNAYEEYAKQNPNFIIEKPLNLDENFQEYEILGRYNYGILRSNEICGDLAFEKFERINIPNRIYEYSMVNVRSVLKKNILPFTEKIVDENNLGIIYKDMNDLQEKIKQETSSEKLNMPRINSYKDLVELVINKIKSSY